MPSNDVHRAIDKLLFNRDYSEVHSTKDLPSKWFGPSHRRYLHNNQMNLIIALVKYPKDPVRALTSAMVHDVVDRANTKAKRQLKQLQRTF